MPRLALSLLLAAILAAGGIPVPALAEATDEALVVVDEEPQGEELEVQDDVTVVEEDELSSDPDEVVIEDGEANATNERETAVLATQAASSYDATLFDEDHLPGVFKTKVQPNTAASATEAPTIRFPQIYDEALTTAPTTHSPAIIVGTARQKNNDGGYIEELGRARSFEEPSPDRVAPYSYFKYTVTTQQAADGSTPKKLTGFDGTYVIARIDVSELWNSLPDNERDQYYLHVQQDKNNALLVAVGMDTTTNKEGRDEWGNISFSNLWTETGADGQATGTSYQRKTASYKLSQMYDSGANDTDKTTPYFDVILFSSASIVAGADAQKEGALNGDVELSFYFDKTADYDPTVNWDPQSQDTTLSSKCHRKFFRDEEAAKTTTSRFLVKGSELHLETMVENSGGENRDTGTTYWAFNKSFKEPYYDQEIDKSKDDMGYGRAIKLMCEVPVVNNLELIGASATELRKRTLDVSSFDIQVANNTSTGDNVYTSGLALKNAWLKITDSNPTTGAELAIGNNATMTIDEGGRLYIDEKCQLEIEWDGATTQQTAGQTTPAQKDILNNGSLDLRKGGEIINDGVITIEGTEGKPYQPGQEQTATSSEKGHGEMTICEGATLTNNGSFMPNGALYVQGTLINKGQFEDYIELNDPDRGPFKYHKGIQLTWKDDVTQQNVIYGGMYVGMDKDWKTTGFEKAVVTNEGDIVICPGELINMAKIENKPNGGIYVCATDRAIIPIEPDPATPTIITKEVDLNEPAAGRIMNWGTINNQGEIRPAQVSVATNGSLNRLILPGNYDDMFNCTCWEKGAITGVGYVYKQNLKKAAVEFIADGETIDSAAYNGAAQTFGMLATVGDNVNPGSNDFTVTYLDPTGATITADKIKDAGAYTVRLKGQNAFTGTISKQFTITPVELTEATLDATTFTYNGKVQKPALKAVKAGDLTLAASDYTAAYSDASAKNAGTYTVTVTGKGNFAGTVEATFTINKKANTIKVKGKTAKVRSAKVAKKAQTIKRAKAYKVTKAKGTRTYKLASVSKKKFKKYFAVNKKTGNITVKKGLKKGTYTLKIKVRAAGTANYKARTKTVKCKVNVA